MVADPAFGKVEREGRARSGKRQHSRRRHVAELLQHREERSLPRRAIALIMSSSASRALGMRDRALELEESVPAVHAIPMRNAVERIEERRVVYYLPPDSLRLPMIVGGVEQPAGSPD